MSNPQKGLKGLTDLFRANGSVSTRTEYATYAFWIFFFAGSWALFRPPVMPSLGDIGASFEPLLTKHDLIGNWIKTVTLSLKAVGISCLVSLVVAYLAVIPFFRPIAFAVSKMRFMSLMGFLFLFMAILRDPGLVRISMLVYGIVPFLVTSMTSIILSRDEIFFNYARTLNLKEGRVVWHVLVRGIASDMLEAVRQNIAIAFVMIAAVESQVREGGGLGMLLYDVERRGANYGEVFAIQIVVFITAALLDTLVSYANRSLFPYAYLKKERNS
ncbi:MAG: ABC transporter permease subunit [Bacteroidetes bacterium]|nr:MAG: ABC transporter permease subunit [Bacteroidota bacterium]